MISVFGSEVGPDERRALEGCLDDQWLGMGARTRAFEARFAKRLGLERFLMLDCGSNALYLAVQLLDLPPGSEVIVPTFTWVACAQAVLLAGHRPVFCDVDLATQNVTAETIAPQLGPKTAAIMVVHYAGKPVDLAPIIELGLPVIEDAAHAVDSQQDGIACGARGDVGIWSFDAVKNLTAGSGGGLTARDPERFERARQLRYCGIGKSGHEKLQAQKQATESNGHAERDSESSQHNGREKHNGRGRWWEYDIGEAFIRALPSDLNAAIALAQLDRLDALQSRRKAIWDRYQAAFADIEAITTPADAAANEQHSWFTYFLQLPNRDAVAHHLLDRDIYTTLRFHPLHLNPVYGCEQRLPNAERLNETGLNIPLHPRLTDDEVDRVIHAVTEAVG